MRTKKEPAWLTRGRAQHAAAYPSPPPLEATIEVTLTPPVELTVKIHAGVLHAVRHLCAGMNDDAIVQTLMEEMLAKFGIEES